MALSDYKLASVLLIALDVTEDEQAGADGAEVFTATPNTGEEKTEAEIIKQNSFLDRFLQTDSVKKQIRIPIPIDDRILPAQHISSSTNMNKLVDYDNKNVVVEPASNGLSLQIRIKNNLTQLSTIAEIITGISNKSKSLFTTSARVSFFSAHTCIFNAYLSGITRQSSPTSELETINLALEVADPNPDVEEKPDKEQTPQIDDDTGAFAFFAGVNAVPTNIPAGASFRWYETLTIDDVLAVPVPEIFSLFTVENLDYTISKAQSLDFSGAARSAITLLYNGVYLPVLLDDKNPYYVQGYAVQVVDSMIRLGVEVQI